MGGEEQGVEDLRDGSPGWNPRVDILLGGLGQRQSGGAWVARSEAGLRALEGHGEQERDATGAGSDPAVFTY